METHERVGEWVMEGIIIWVDTWSSGLMDGERDITSRDGQKNGLMGDGCRKGL